jgi:hypothetical protein
MIQFFQLDIDLIGLLHQRLQVTQFERISGAKQRKLNHVQRISVAEFRKQLSVFDTTDAEFQGAVKISG